MADQITEAQKEKCQRSFKSTDSKPCYFGDPKGDKLVVLWGDSHANHWFPALNAGAKENGWKVAYYTKVGCRTLDYGVTTMDTRRECVNWVKATQKRIIASDPDLVVIGARWNMPVFTAVAEGDPGSRVAGLRPGDTESSVGLRPVTTALNDAKIPTALIVDNPVSPNSVPRCVARTGLNDNTCDWPLPNDFGRTEAAAARGLPYVHTVDLNSYLCPDGTCKAVIDGTITLRDDDHLSIPFVESLTGELMQELRPLVR